MNILLAAAFIAATQVYRLELTDETPYIVGEDGVKREVCIVDPERYAMMTGRVEQVWRSMNADENGRTKLHGKRIGQEIIDNVKVTTYDDGYRHSEKMEQKKAETIRPFKTIEKKKVPDSRISERHQKMREELAARKAGKVKEVTVEHDATTGKDIVK